jgi:maltose alpha-D-glucosyltransferase/alpha-amylase
MPKTRTKARPSPLAADPLWYRDAIIYEVRVRSFHDGNGDGIGDFKGLTEKLDYLEELGVDTLWLLPFYPSPLRDDGYDISHYTEVHPDMGSMEDFQGFLAEAHRRGLRVITELVLNHTSDAHAWFQRARAAPAGSVERDFYVWSESADKYAEARIIFKDFERSNWTWDPMAEAYYWHRFYSHQPDLNFDNPAVWTALLACVDYWLELGVDGLRLDAVPYLFEREGTTCENLPETLEFLRHLRRHVDASHPGRMLLAEANQWPEDSVRYLEGGDKCHMAFHFPVMPRMYLALHAEDRFPLVDILAQTPALPDTCQWALFLRNHDELTLEMVTDEERDYLYEAYAKEPKMRLNLGIRRRLAPLLENDRRKLELLNCLLFSLPGTPVLYYGDEIGMGENIHLEDRNGVRTPMQWSSDRNAGFSKANPQSLYLPVVVDPEYHFETLNVETQQRNPNSLLWWQKRLIALRKRYRAFGRGTLEMLQPENHRILAFLREYGEERILVVINLSRFSQYTELDLSRFQGAVPVELFGNTVFPPVGGGKYPFTPGPHMVLWFSLTAPAVPVPGQDGAQRAALPVLEDFHGRLPSRPTDALEAVVAAYLPACPWYAGRGRKLKTVRIAQSMPVRLPAQAAHKEAHNEAQILLVQCDYEEGPDDTYFLPVLALQGAEAAEALARVPACAIAALPSLSAPPSPSGSGAVEGADGVLIDAMGSPEFCAALYRKIRGQDRAPRKGDAAPPKNGGRKRSDEDGLRGGRSRAFLADDQPESLPARLLDGQRRHTSVVFGNKYILKMYRRLEAGVNPDLEISRYLTEHSGFANSPKVEGWLEVKLPGGEWGTLGLMQEFIPDARDAWAYTREEVFKFFDRALAADNPSGSQAPAAEAGILDAELPELAKTLAGGFLAKAELLGKRTAEMHLALSQSQGDPRFAAEKYGIMNQRSAYQSMRNLALKVMRQLRRNLASLPPEAGALAQDLLAGEKRVLAILEEFKSTPITATRMFHHGDLQLGKVLYTGKDFMIRDFEGEPMRSSAERRRKRSPLRDVAGMIRSFHFASVSALYPQADSGVVRSTDLRRLEEWGRRWYHWVSIAFSRAYQKAAEGGHFLPGTEREYRVLMRAFLLEKALYEVAYELENQPSWTGIPLQGIRDLLATAEPPGSAGSA